MTNDVILFNYPNTSHLHRFFASTGVNMFSHNSLAN